MKHVVISVISKKKYYLKFSLTKSDIVFLYQRKTSENLVESLLYLYYYWNNVLSFSFLLLFFFSACWLWWLKPRVDEQLTSTISPGVQISGICILIVALGRLKISKSLKYSISQSTKRQIITINGKVNF